VRSERGITLIETILAGAILTIVAAGLLPIFVVGIQATNQQGDIATRTTEYAQDKMEQLLSLSATNISSEGFNDGWTDTTVFPSNPTGCTNSGTSICGLGGTMAASSTMGSIPPAAPVTHYVDYLDVNGNLLTTSTGAYYTRQWKIVTDSTATLKTITVVVTSSQAAGFKGAPPSTTLVSVKSSGL
jgi:type II secretory pathway pseudopilin PulG